MSQFIYFTPKEKEAARNADIADMLMRAGEKLKRSGSEYEWGEGSERVTIRGNLWYHQYEQKGGNAVSFVQRFMDKTYVEAMKYILGNGAGEIAQKEPKQSKPKEKKEFEPPELNEDAKRAYAYLNVRRGIPKDVLVPFFKKKLIGETREYHNVAFMGYDTNGNLKHVNLRGTQSNSTFKGNAAGSTLEYSFRWTGKSEKLYLFEAPIDMLSFIAMKGEDWEEHSYVACCGVGDRVLFQTLKDNPNISMVFLCLDNDRAGRFAEYRIAEKLREENIRFGILLPDGKDWNEDLLTEKEQTILKNAEVQKCQGLRYS
ncbi:MAG: DUF3991 and toprim domain-containing protein [Candidatus Borkfalkiaceae bacterium]|nr:DUF3991 and toprim domain-containing protein [Christensenellaceae bacterium]